MGASRLERFAMNTLWGRPAALAGLLLGVAAPCPAQARNPIIHADVPDIAIIRVGGTYYMSSTTMHMSPGLPIMKSTDLVNWQLVSYAYQTLGDGDALTLSNGRSAYGQGSWASSLRYHDGTFYATTFSSTTGRTHVFTTQDIEHGPWRASSFRPSLHDHSLFFDDDGRVYLVHGAGDIRLTELAPDVSGIKQGGLDQVIIRNASAVAGPNIGLRAEGSQLFKVDGRYYLFNITWPRGGMRTALVHRADRITGPWEGRVALQDQGVAQGGLIDTPDGRWFAYLFQDHGAVGRTPWLVPVKWAEGWPVLGVDGKAPTTLGLPASTGPIPGIALLVADRAPWLAEIDRRAGRQRPADRSQHADTAHLRPPVLGHDRPRCHRPQGRRSGRPGSTAAALWPDRRQSGRRRPVRRGGECRDGCSHGARPRASGSGNGLPEGRVRLRRARGQGAVRLQP
jgi:hypothetical protein